MDVIKAMKRKKDTGALIGAQSRARIFDSNAQGIGISGAWRHKTPMQTDRALASELAGIGEQVENHLLELHRIGENKFWHISINIHQKVEIFALKLGCHNLIQDFGHLSHRHRLQTNFC